MDDEITEFIAGVTPMKRRRDARTLLALFARATSEQPRLQGTIIGYGKYDYRYDSGRTGTSPAAAFSPRKAATSIYLADGTSAHTERLARLGPHRAAVGCVYLTDLEQNDLGVLEEIVRASFRTLTAGTYTSRARDGE
ncbi:DUF1801 domain-containing protein [Propionimicrobium sp. PCR01-08-3]|uniref:DUF1801 domain-containing protein n=1 Tax=Propionimicrobium sp. PCR01-08-3 TaxID=3052086 RepID=UPI00255CF178|nr:DUF1801 domain-containing protein [Propionimicrobium sp. PCR01-08-3]WIY83088.1 DUF1801 domain-containing protein [Propionimicrobium sp. PCR01-08-3]